jgi:hypothetical protein
MGDGERASLKHNLNPKVRFKFHRATITSSAGLPAARELDEALRPRRCSKEAAALCPGTLPREHRIGPR